MHHLEKETILSCSPQEAFDFHMNPENITKISPPWGVEIKEITEPILLVDEAFQSPFTYWCHTHHFEPFGKKTKMINSIDFLMPLGWVGTLFVNFIYKGLDKIFQFRHQVTEKLLDKQCTL
ncbi:MAG: hypothetical protein K0U47_07865 [Epsilonproteobacteria bacterium]|nr:hypothetical protein [Campylobacterota bacterium]